MIPGSFQSWRTELHRVKKIIRSKIYTCFAGLRKRGAGLLVRVMFHSTNKINDSGCVLMMGKQTTSR